jgi:hypothetical protein
VTRGRLVVAAAVLLAVLVAPACGGDEAPPVRPAKVPDGLVPTGVQANAFLFYESTLPQVKDAFASAGKRSLAADGRLYELRKDDRLVGALQLTTLLPDVDLHKGEHRDKILRQLLPTGRDEFMVGEVNVWAVVTDEKQMYLWFAENMYALLTLKPGSDDNLDPEGVLTEVVNHSSSSDAWKPLYIDEELKI